MEERHSERISKACPDLEARSVEVNDEGLNNEILIINDDIIFRFAKHEQAKVDLEVELEVLNLIRSLASLNVPNPFYVESGFIAYQKLHGETLSRSVLTELSEAEQQEIANQLALFLKALHNAPVSELSGELRPTPAPVKWADWNAIREGVEEKVYPLLLKYQRKWAENLFDGVLQDSSNFDYQPCLIHGDLGPYHILFDAKTKMLNGILDFGIAGLGDAALDIAPLLTNYGESFVGKMRLCYPEMEMLMKRARFYSQAFELQWAYLGIETGKTFWFTAHLGSAKDVQSFNTK